MTSRAGAVAVRNEEPDTEAGMTSETGVMSAECHEKAAAAI